MRRRIPPLDTLLCFDAASRHESYTRAAQELALTQSAVSRRVAALEDFLGVQLFRRTRHGVALTQAGTTYARQTAQRLASLERDALDTMAQQGEGGAISLAAVPTFATRWLLPRLPSFAKAHPEVQIHIETRTRAFLFADTEFDAALFAGTQAQVTRWAGTRAQLLMHEDVIPVCSPSMLPRGKAVTPAAIARMPLLQQSTRPDMWATWFDAQGVNAPTARSGPRYELFSMTAVAAAQGMGVAMVPVMLVQDELRRGELAVACNRLLRAERAYYLIVPQVTDSKPGLTAFSGWLAEQAAPFGSN